MLLVVELVLLAAAAVLGVVHRDVGVLDQLLDVLSVARVERDADAGRDRHVASVEVHGFRQRMPDLLGDPGQLLRRADAFDDHRELVAAQPRDRIHLAQESLEALRHDLEHPVAGGVSEGIVDLLEAVEVEEHQPDHGLLAFGAADRLRNRS